MSLPLIVIVSLAFPLLWTSAFVDRHSLHQALKLRECISEVLAFLGEWENDQLTVSKILILKSYPQNLSNQLQRIRGYTFVRFAMRLPRKTNIQTAAGLIQQFCESTWQLAPGFRLEADALALQIKKLLR